MSYIVFDLEWNQPNDGIPSSERKLLFEIIEIGAVKLDDNMNIISSFSEIIKPQVYKKLNWHIQKMLKIRMADLKGGTVFPVAMKRFLKWCGDSPIFMSWGPQDLTELQRNMAYYKMEPLSDGPIAFYDVQKLFSRKTSTEGSSKNLEAAIDMMNIEKDIPFHRAYSDAYYTAKILKRIDKSFLHESYVYDLYHIPASGRKELHVLQGNEYYFVSRGYEERQDLTDNRRILAMNCAKCNYRAIRPKVRWFSSNTKIYYGAAICPTHGPIKGKLKVRKDERGLFFAEKFLTYCDNKDVDDIKARKTSIKKKSVAKEAEVTKDAAQRIQD